MKEAKYINGELVGLVEIGRDKLQNELRIEYWYGRLSVYYNGNEIKDVDMGKVGLGIKITRKNQIDITISKHIDKLDIRNLDISEVINVNILSGAVDIDIKTENIVVLKATSIDHIKIKAVACDINKSKIGEVSIEDDTYKCNVIIKETEIDRLKIKADKCKMENSRVNIASIEAYTVILEANINRLKLINNKKYADIKGKINEIICSNTAYLNISKQSVIGRITGDTQKIAVQEQSIVDDVRIVGREATNVEIYESQVNRLNIKYRIVILNIVNNNINKDSSRYNIEADSLNISLLKQEKYGLCVRNCIHINVRHLTIIDICENKCIGDKLLISIETLHDYKINGDSIRASILKQITDDVVTDKTIVMEAGDRIEFNSIDGLSNIRVIGDDNKDTELIVLDKIMSSSRQEEWFREQFKKVKLCVKVNTLAHKFVMVNNINHELIGDKEEIDRVNNKIIKEKMMGKNLEDILYNKITSSKEYTHMLEYMSIGSIERLGNTAKIRAYDTKCIKHSEIIKDYLRMLDIIGTKLDIIDGVEYTIAHKSDYTMGGVNNGKLIYLIKADDNSLLGVYKINIKHANTLRVAGRLTCSTEDAYNILKEIDLIDTRIGVVLKNTYNYKENNMLGKEVKNLINELPMVGVKFSNEGHTKEFVIFVNDKYMLLDSDGKLIEVTEAYVKEQIRKDII
jgi:hypothetical protein